MGADAYTIGALTVAVVGVGFASKQYKDAREAITQLKDANSGITASRNRLVTVADTLDSVAHALPTRVLGELDHYLTDLADIIERAKNCVTIVCDYPAYGTFADPKGAEAYYRAIEDRLIQGVTIRVIFLTKERRNALNDTFWTQEDAWTPDFRERVDWYVNTRLHNSTPSSDHVARPELLDVLEQESLMVIDRLNTAARTGFARHGKQLLSRRETSSLMPVYCWVRDGAEAAFAIAMLKEGRNKETAFATVDPGLVAVLEGVYDRYLEEAATLTDELAPTMP